MPTAKSKDAAAVAAASAKRQDSRLRIELTEAQKNELRQAFDLFDSEGTGRIQAQEIKVALRALGYEVKKDELKGLLLEVGSSPTGTLDFNEFLRVLLLKIGEKESREEVQRAYKHFDESDKGYIGFEDLKQIAKSLGHGHLTDDELREMIDFAHPRAKKPDGTTSSTGGNAGRDVHMTEEDFMRLMKRANVY